MVWNIIGRKLLCRISDSFKSPESHSWMVLSAHDNLDLGAKTRQNKTTTNNNKKTLTLYETVHALLGE